MYNRKSIFLFLFVVVYLWAYTLSNFQSAQGFFTPQPYKVSTTYVEHASIYINGNTDFINQANAEDWSGEGTALNPYLISGYEIVGSGSGSLISIRETNIYFQVSDCKLDAGYYGIFLRNVANGEVSNNEITNSEEGIRLDYSQDIRVADNTISNNIFGISLYYSGNNIVTSNTIIAGGLYIFGEEFEDFVQTKVSNNTVNGDPIVFWQDVSGGTIPVGAGQIFLINCTSVGVSGQYLVGLSVGLVTAFSSDINIHENTISSDIRGIYLRLSENITVINNTFSDNDRGLFLSDSGHNTILNNTFVKDGLYIYGGQFEATLQANVSGNIVNGKPLVFWQDIDDNVVPAGAGQVILIHCSSIEVKDQKLDNSAVGLITHYCTDLYVHNNSMNDNFWGIYMEKTNNSDFTHNLVCNNSQNGVYLEDSNNNSFIFNHFINNTEDRHAVNYGNNNTFMYNYWSNWISPYTIPGYSDSYDPSPLVSPNTHLLLPPTIIYPEGVGILSSIVTISWTPALGSLGHQITYAVFYSLDGRTWVLLSSGLTSTMYQWETKNLETDESTYIIKVVATCSGGFTAEDVSGHKSTYNNGTNLFIISLLLIPILLGFLLFVYYGYYRYGQRKPSAVQETAIRERLKPLEHEMDKEVISRDRIEPSKDLTSLKPVLEKPEEFVPAITHKSKPSEVIHPTKSAIKLVDEDKKALFSSIQYRVQDLIYEQGETGLVVRLVPYSGSIKEIRVNFENKQIIMSGCSKRDNLPKVTLELKTRGEPRGPSWGEPWRDIIMTGDKEVIAGIKPRSEISNSLNSLGTALVKVFSPVEGEIYIKITCNETSEAVKQAYSLITDLQSFFEISYY
ncbi:MAG: NosD domain-containing protein [Candidatus Hodarchaeales archaeon]